MGKKRILLLVKYKYTLAVLFVIFSACLYSLPVEVKKDSSFIIDPGFWVLVCAFQFIGALHYCGRNRPVLWDRVGLVFIGITSILSLSWVLFTSGHLSGQEWEYFICGGLLIPIAVTANFRLSHYFTFVFMSALFVVLLLPVGFRDYIKETPHLDKWAHGMMFLVLVFVYGGELDRFRNHDIKSLLSAILFLLVVVAALTELLQAYVFTARTGDWMDFLADCFGGLLGVFTFLLFRQPLRVLLNYLT